MPTFFLIVTSLVLFFHAYIGWRLIPRPRLAGKRKLLWLLLAASALSVPATFIFGRRLEPGLLVTGLTWFGFTCLGLMGIFAALVFARDLLLLGARVAPGATDPKRREFLRRASTLGVVGAGVVLGVEGVWGASRPPKLERVQVPIAGLPEALRGFSIAQISDTHLGPTLGHDFMKGVVYRVNELSPDLIAFTGDLADGYVEHMRKDVAPLKALKAKHGVYYVTGNHEYYWRHQEWVAHAKELGMVALTNEHRMLDVSGAKLAVGGVPDLREGGRLERHGSDPKRAFMGADEADVKLLLAHQPKSLFGAQEAGVDLQLCGHTHGGQVFPMNLLVYLAHPIVSGLGRFGSTWVYVNRGTAYWGPPMRTGGAGEITLVELVRA